jgi:hypothetical protein
VRLGRIATGAKRYEEFLARVKALPKTEAAKHAARVDKAQEELEQLRTLVPVLVVQLDAKTGDRVRINGRTLEPDELGGPLRLDPGEYVVALETAEGIIEERRVELERSKGYHLELGHARPRPKAPPDEDPAPAEAPAPRGGFWSSPLFLSALGVGAVGVSIGAVSGALALSAEGCPDGRCADAEALEEAKRAQAMAHVSTASFIVGAFGAAGAIAIVLSSEKPAEAGTALRLRVSGNGAFIGGAF